MIIEPFALLSKEGVLFITFCICERSDFDLEFTTEPSFDLEFFSRRLLQLEEEYIAQICREIIELKPDLVITEKGVSDLAQHYLAKADISVIRRVRKSDNNRIAR